MIVSRAASGVCWCRLGQWRRLLLLLRVLVGFGILESFFVGAPRPELSESLNLSNASRCSMSAAQGRIGSIRLLLFLLLLLHSSSMMGKQRDGRPLRRSEVAARGVARRRGFGRRHVGETHEASGLETALLLTGTWVLMLIPSLVLLIIIIILNAAGRAAAVLTLHKSAATISTGGRRRREARRVLGRILWVAAGMVFISKGALSHRTRFRSEDGRRPRTR